MRRSGTRPSLVSADPKKSAGDDDDSEPHIPPPATSYHARCSVISVGRARRFDVAVTGLGLVTPAGIGVEVNRDRVWCGLSAASPAKELAGLPVDFSCRVEEQNAESLVSGAAWSMERVSQLGVAAARQAIADAALDPTTWDGARVGVAVGTAFGGQAAFERGLDAFREDGVEHISNLLTVTAPVNMTAAYIAMDCMALGPNQVVSSACASGATAIGYARMLLEARACDVVIAGGSEAALTPLCMAGLDRKRALSRRTTDPATASRPFDVDRDGMVAGEGAGMLVLERYEDAKARRARIRARISGFGASADGYHPARPEPTGAGAERAIRAALADAAITPDQVDHINAHGSSTPLNDLTESRVIRRVFSEHPVVTSTKGAIGHLIGAAGAVEAAYTVLAVEFGSVPPTANLFRQDPEIAIDVVTGQPRPMAVDTAISNSFGFGGQNAVIVVTAA